MNLRASEEPSLFDKTESMPGLKGPEPGEMLHLPILSDIEVTDCMGTRWASEMCWTHMFPLEGLFPGPPDPELGDALGLPDFSPDIDPGPGVSFPRSGSILIRPVILDDCVPNPGRYLPESGEPSSRCEGVLSGRDAWNAIKNEHEGPPCQ